MTGEHRDIHEGDNAGQLDADDQPHDGHRTVDDAFISLLEGLRVSLTGTQVLFAFLLTVPLQRHDFPDDPAAQRWAFTVAFLSAGLASVLLISPSVHQRLRAPSTGMARRSERHLRITIAITNAGTIAMGVAIVATVVYVALVAFDGPLEPLAPIGIGVAVLWAWFYLPLVTFARRR